VNAIRLPHEPPRALLVDLDGTLLDTLPDFVLALGRLADGFGVERPTATWVRNAIGRGGPRLVRDALQHWQLPADAFESAWLAYQSHYAAANGKQARLFAGTVEALQALHRGSALRLACVTNKPQAMAQALLAQFELDGYFAAVVGAAPGVRAKPHPDALLLACQQLACSPEQTWMVGDSRNDFEAARNAGCAATVLLRCGYNHGEPVDAVPASRHLDRLDQLPALLSGLSSSPQAAPP
jgi:phosphoglycolate phosphatase